MCTAFIFVSTNNAHIFISICTGQIVANLYQQKLAENIEPRSPPQFSVSQNKLVVVSNSQGGDSYLKTYHSRRRLVDPCEF